MQLSDHSLRQLDAATLERLEEEALRVLSMKLLADLKEARERLNQNSRNSSRPPGSDPPWGNSPGRRPGAEEEVGEEDEGRADPEAGAADEPPPQACEAPGEVAANGETAGVAAAPKRAAGKVPGTPGRGRAAPERIDATVCHAPTHCACCGQPLEDVTPVAYSGHYEVDFERTEDGGWRVVTRLHAWQERRCACGHVTRAEPYRRLEDGRVIGGFRLIGPGLATLLVALNLRYRLSRSRIREFLGDWLGVTLSVGAIHAAIEEAGLRVAPVEAELVEAVRQSGLLKADETPWPEQGAADQSLWLWVFIGAGVTLYCISHRGKELVRNLLEDYTGVLMSDGWQAYRWLNHRLRCWAHLQRKAVGLTESFDREAQTFGRAVLELWGELQAAVHRAREGPPGSIRGAFEARLQAFRRRCEARQACAHGKTRNLANEFLNDWEAIFAVLDHPLWPLTNNDAERALRHWVILRRLSHGTRTARGSRGLALLASVIETCRQRGHSPWAYLQTAISRGRQNLPLQPLPQA